MRKKLNILLIFIILAVVLTMAIACSPKDADGLKKISTPGELAINGNTVSWQSVNNAKKYYVRIMKGEWQEEYNTEATSYNINVTELGEYSVQVRAYGDGKKTGYSDYSKAITYIKKTAVATPTVVVNDKTASWGAVEGAVKYSYKIVLRDGKTEIDAGITELLTYSFDDDKYKGVNSYTITVIAIPSDDNKELVASRASEPVKYIVSETLAIPELSAISSTSISWSAVKNVDKYVVRLTYLVDGTQNEYTTASTSYSKSSMNLLKAGDYKVQVMAKGDGEIYKDSAFSAESAEFTMTKIDEINAKNVKIEYDKNGKATLKLTFTSADELNNIDYFNFSLKTLKADGKSVLTTLQNKVVVTRAENVPVLEYSYLIDDLFYKESIIQEDGKDKVIIEYIQTNEDYYGKNFTLTLQAASSSNKIIPSENFTLAEEYISSKKPDYNVTAGYYEIYNVGELAYIAKEPTANYMLMNNIDYHGYNFPTILEFSGKFYGNNKIISELVLYRDFSGEGKTIEENAIGFFGKLTETALVSDLYLTDLRVNENSSGKTVGGIAVINNGKISGCYVSGELKANTFNTKTDYEKTILKNVGGIVAINNGTVDGCVSDVNMTGEFAGGLVALNDGLNTAIISNSRASGNINSIKSSDNKEGAQLVAGGLVGENKGVIIWSFALGDIKAANNIDGDTTKDDITIGGFVGRNYGTITNSYSGNLYSRDSKKQGLVVASGTGATAGGFAGRNAGNIINASATAKAEGTGFSGGFVGDNSGLVYIAFASGGTANNGKRGGFVANNTGKVVDAFYYSLNETRENSDAVKINSLDELKNLATNLVAGVVTAGVEGYVDATKDVPCGFGNVASSTMPHIVGMLYLEAYSLEIKANANIMQQATIVKPDGTIVSFNADNLKDVAGAQIDILGDKTVKGTIFARYSYGGQSVLLKVKVK